VGKLAFKNESLIHYFLDNAEFPCIMKEEIAPFEILQNRSKYLSFILHRAALNVQAQK
jgi:hypothetical protein